MYYQDLQISSNPKVYRSFKQNSDKFYSESNEEPSETSVRNMDVLVH
jgi:hypothetical protein